MQEMKKRAGGGREEALAYTVAEYTWCSLRRSLELDHTERMRLKVLADSRSGWCRIVVHKLDRR